MIYLYAEKLTPRVQYVCTHVFSVMLNKEITWVNTMDKLPDPSSHVVVAYTSETCPKGVYQIVPHGLLFKKGLKKQMINMGEWHGLKTFFSTRGGSIPFDIFSAIFYLISRYEEYVASAKDFDEYGRFCATASLAFQEGFLNQPLVDKWVQEFEKDLANQIDCYGVGSQRRFTFRPVIVIDTLFKYQNNSFIHNSYHFWRKLIKGRWSALKLQIKAILRISDDPYCNFASLLQLHNRNNLSPVFFLRVSYDVWWKRPVYAFTQTYRKLLSHNYLFELHSSPEAAVNIHKLMAERKNLFKITKSQVTMNCFHNLAYQLPGAYRNLLKASFKEDYSMVYPEEIGFRASTCTPYRYYDLEKEDYFKLTIHPIALCDDMLRGKKYSREDIHTFMLQLANEVRSVKGEFVCIFHNDILSDTGRWRHWLSVYESSIRAIANMEVKS